MIPLLTQDILVVQVEERLETHRHQILLDLVTKVATLMVNQKEIPVVVVEVLVIMDLAVAAVLVLLGEILVLEDQQVLVELEEQEFK
jgi:hypothetical protein